VIVGFEVRLSHRKKTITADPRKGESGSAPHIGALFRLTDRDRFSLRPSTPDCHSNSRFACMKGSALVLIALLQVA
jgi:hypothetical protein